VERLKPAYFTAKQEEHLLNKPITVQPLTETFLSKKAHSILKTYSCAVQLKSKKTLRRNFQSK